LLELVGLPPQHFADRWPDELSGGERQRVGVARALGADPPVLLMDEPFGALDPLTRAELHGEFRRIQGRVRKTVIIVTHDMGEAFAPAARRAAAGAAVMSPASLGAFVAFVRGHRAEMFALLAQHVVLVAAATAI